jgi:hypothetical protein
MRWPSTGRVNRGCWAQAARGKMLIRRKKVLKGDSLIRTGFLNKRVELLIRLKNSNPISYLGKGLK